MAARYISGIGADAVDRLARELRLLQARDEVLSTNVRLGLRRLPLSDGSAPTDPGAAVYCKLKGEPRSPSHAARSSASATGPPPLPRPSIMPIRLYAFRPPPRHPAAVLRPGALSDDSNVPKARLLEFACSRQSFLTDVLLVKEVPCAKLFEAS
jgi:hypothetical protein